MNKKDLLAKFKTKTKKITVKAWDDMEVTIRELTVSESNDIQSLMLNDATSRELASGEINVSIDKFEDAKLKAVSLALVEPKITESELGNFGTSGKDGISEIYEAIGELNLPKK